MTATPATEYVKARIDRTTKVQAERVLNKLGISASDAIRMFYRQVALHNGMPFSLHIPNATTRASLQSKKISKEFSSAEDMFKDILGNKHRV